LHLIFQNAQPYPYATIAKPEEGALSDIAPTLLLMMGVEQPDEMTGSSLITFK
jgi:2,3-bisphosphoglycerate-independent phosphoglycerate mutase